VKDEHSFGNPQQVQVTHIDLDLGVDFTKRSLSGTATLTLRRNQPTARTLVLDDENLKIEKVEAATRVGKFREAGDARRAALDHPARGNDAGAHFIRDRSDGVGPAVAYAGADGRQEPPVSLFAIGGGARA
jgi:aminopeptidase N